MIGIYDYTVIATYLATVFGLWGIFLAWDGRAMGAIVCLLLAGFLDTFDGRIARTKKDRTEQGRQFGIQIDSLNDLVCFGVLPACICRSAYLYRFGGSHPVLLGAVCCVFVLAGLIRLAYFNVTEEERQRETSGTRKVYLGLPITASCLICPLLYLLASLLPKAAAVILPVGLLVTGLLYILPLHIPKPGLKGILLMALLGAAELFGLIYVAKNGVMPLE